MRQRFHLTREDKITCWIFKSLLNISRNPLVLPYSDMWSALDRVASQDSQATMKVVCFFLLFLFRSVSPKLPHETLYIGILQHCKVVRRTRRLITKFIKQLVLECIFQFVILSILSFFTLKYYFVYCYLHRHTKK